MSVSLVLKIDFVQNLILVLSIFQSLRCFSALELFIKNHLPECLFEHNNVMGAHISTQSFPQRALCEEKSNNE